MDDQELQQIYRDLQETLKLAADEQRLLGKTSATTEKALEALRREATADAAAFKRLAAATDAAVEAEKKSLEYRKQLGQSAKQTGSAMKGLAGTLAAGNTGFAQFGSLISSIAGSLGSMLSIIPGVEGAFKAIGGAGSAVMGQIDLLAKSYNELAEVGGITATGVDGLRKQFDNLGLVSLPGFADAIKKNSLGLAALGSTTSRGATMFGNAIGQLTNPDGPFVKPLLNLGYTVEQINAIGAEYIANQTLMGNRQIRTTEQLVKAMDEYLRQTDEVARATGRTREQILEENRKNLANVRFRARIEELRNSGQSEQADQLEAYVNRLGGALGDAARAQIAGVPLTQEAQGAVVLFGNQMAESIQSLERGSNATDEYRKTMEAGYRGLQTFNKNIQYGSEGVLGGGQVVREAMDMAALYRRARDLGVDPAELAKQEQERLKAAGGATKDLVGAQVAIADAGRELQRLGMDALPLATSAVEKFATTVAGAAELIRKFTGQAAPTGREKGFSRGGAAAQTPTTQDYLAKVQRLESGGRNIQNLQGSSAFGLYQIMPETYAGLVANAAPNSPLKGTTFEQMKSDVDLQRAAMEALTEENAKKLARRGLSTDDSAKYMAHVLGYGRAARILEANEGTPLERLIDPKTLAEIRQKNQTLFSEDVKTAGDLRKRFRDKVRGATVGPNQSALGRNIAGPNDSASSGNQQEGYRNGGIATGPRSGYMSVLHGTEAVVPLPDGRTIPVSMPSDITSGINQQVNLLSNQLSKLDELIGAMRAQTAISQKILQHSTS